MESQLSIDLNADLGEGFGTWSLGHDDELLGVVSSANVACGFHAGDPSIMLRVCRQAVANGVAIGAQVGYHDLVGFGRRRIDVARADLMADVLYQLGALDACARAAGGRVSYLKPHGALYNTAVHDVEQAAAIVDAVGAFDAALPILTLPGSVLANLATNHGIPCVVEAFADRAYLPDGTLMPRSEPGSVLHDVDEVAARALQMARGAGVLASDGSRIALRPASICVHGDTPGAVAIARAVRDALRSAGVTLAPFVR